MRWLRRRRPAPAAPMVVVDPPVEEGAALPPRPRGDTADPYRCTPCRRGASGPWCGLCGRPTRATVLGTWDRPTDLSRTT